MGEREDVDQTGIQHLAGPSAGLWALDAAFVNVAKGAGGKTLDSAAFMCVRRVENGVDEMSILPLFVVERVVC